MILVNKIKEEFQKAMLAKDELKTSTLRMLKAAIQNLEIELKAKKKELTDESIIEIVAREIKKRKEAIEAFVKGARADLAEKENKELEILSAYLPEQLPEDKLREIIRGKIKETGATGSQDFGKVMGSLMKEVKGKADGNLVGKIVKEELGK